MNAQAAVEAPRFQTRHLVSSFDNHAWNRGDLMLDERIPHSVAAELAARGHKVGYPLALGQRRRSGDDPGAAGWRDRSGRRSVRLPRRARLLSVGNASRFLTSRGSSIGSG